MTIFSSARRLTAVALTAASVSTGQLITPTTYRKNLSGIINAPVVFLSNVAKS